MLIDFHKYHGAGNDFIIIDARKSDQKAFTQAIVRQFCHRHFGIGGDGLILLQSSDIADFHMKYFNADGKEGTMCGNGGRCISAFAKDSGIVKESEIEFTGIDGMHRAVFRDNGEVSLKMTDVSEIRNLDDGYFLDTGSPHFVTFVDSVREIDVNNTGRKLRHDNRFGPDGANINFISSQSDRIDIRTFERGVENETLACGTGCVAAAISAQFHSKSDNFSFILNAEGGVLRVDFEVNNNGNYQNIWLTGPARFVFRGSIII